ncbi:MAG TPA: hypothetical protein VHL50_12095 [Pyrinomonadaceae bacterium]|nr:hypothetical protein [Pyrinomonadaceae bacterium]
MQTEQTENILIIRETPGCLWIFGLFFLTVGGLFVYGALGGFADYGAQELWMLALAFLMGAVGVAVGVWMIYRAPITRVVIDRLEDTVFITRYGLFGRREDFYESYEIEQFCLIEDVDDESSPIFSLGMNLASGETVKISSLPNHDERFIQNFVFQTNEFMRKTLPFCEMILDAADERDAEIG